MNEEKKKEQIEQHVWLLGGPRAKQGERLNALRSFSHYLAEVGVCVGETTLKNCISPRRLSAIAYWRHHCLIVGREQIISEQQGNRNGTALAPVRVKSQGEPLTRRCSRRITLAFLPFEAKVSAMGNVPIRAGKRARG